VDALTDHGSLLSFFREVPYCSVSGRATRSDGTGL